MENASTPHNSPGRAEPFIWLNGEVLPLSRARISPLDRGLLFGDGLFETLRAQEGEVLQLDRHLDRLNASARFLKIPLDQGLDWPAILQEVLSANHLERGLARVKIVATRGEAPGLGLPRPESPTLMALADRYHAPSPEAYALGWDLAVHRLGPGPALSPHKTLSYLYYMAARQNASDLGAHEALILDPKGNAAETAAGSLLFFNGNEWIAPESPFQLPGTARRQAVELMEEDGEAVVARPAPLEELVKARTVWISNSLLGIMPVRSVDKTPIPDMMASRAANVRERMFGARA